MTWKDIKYFSPKEFDSPDAPDSGLMMNVPFVRKLDELRERCGFPFVIRSGYRTLTHNQRVEGVAGSAHRTGLAADIRAESGTAKFLIVANALELGFRRIGVGATFIHLDCDLSKPQDVVWTY